MEPEERKRLEAESNRAARARRILEDPLVVEAFTGIESMLVTKWLASPPEDLAAREEAYRMLGSMRGFRTLLTRHLNTGKLADKALRDAAGKPEEFS